MSFAPSIQPQPRRKTLGVRRQHTPPSFPTSSPTAAHATSPPANTAKRVGLSKRKLHPSSAAGMQQQQQLLVQLLSPVPPTRAANGSSHSHTTTSTAPASSQVSSPPATAAAALASITSSLDAFTEATQHAPQRPPASQQPDGGTVRRHKRRRESEEDGEAEDESDGQSEHSATQERAERRKATQPTKRGQRQTRKRDEADADKESEQDDEEGHTHSGERDRLLGPPRKLVLPASDSNMVDGPDATTEELNRVADINTTLADMCSSNRQLANSTMRQRLKVNVAFVPLLLAEYKGKGEVSVQAWREMKSQRGNRRRSVKRPAVPKSRQRWEEEMADEERDDEKESEADASDEREWDDILDNLQGEESRKDEKIENEAAQNSTPSSQDSNGQSVSGLTTPRHKGAAAADGTGQPTAEDAAKVELINKALLQVKLRGEKLTQERLRKMLQVSTSIMNPLMAVFDKSGGKLSMAQWMAVKQQANNKRRADSAKRKQDLANTASLYQLSSRRDSSVQLDQHELDAIIASSQADSINGSQDSTMSRASRIPTGEPQQDELDKMALINRVMADVVASGEEVKVDDLRRRLHVGTHFPGPIEAIYRQNGEVTVQDWRNMRRQLSEQRSAEVLQQKREAAAIEMYKRANANNHRPSREERVEIRKREEEAAREAARLKKQRAEEEAKRRVEVEAQKKRDREEKAQRKAEAEAAKKAKDEAKLAKLAKEQRGRPQADDDGLATESDSDREEQERLEEERKAKMRRLEEKRMKLEQDQDEEDWTGDTKVRGKKPLSSAKAEKAAASAAAAAAKKEQELQTKAAELNAVMTEWEKSGRQWSRDEMRKQLKVGGDFPTMILAEWKAKGVLSVEGWRAMRKKVSAHRMVRRRGNDEQVAPKPKPPSSHTVDTTNGTASHASSSSSSHPSTGHKKKLKRTDSDNDLSFHHHSESTALPSADRSLRRRTKVDYTAQLEEDPHTIVELTWYPTKADQPFRIVIDPVVPAVMDVHAHMADVEIIGVLAGQWLADRRLLWVQSAYPCQQVGTDDDLTNVEIDPASLISVQETAEGRGMRLVGWYHSHPYFRNQPSLVDVENQSRYQKMFGEAGSKNSSSSGRHGMPFIGGIITPYGKGEFKPLPSSIKW